VIVALIKNIPCTGFFDSGYYYTYDMPSLFFCFLILFSVVVIAGCWMQGVYS